MRATGYGLGPRWDAEPLGIVATAALAVPGSPALVSVQACSHRCIPKRHIHGFAIRPMLLPTAIGVQKATGLRDLYDLCLGRRAPCPPKLPAIGLPQDRIWVDPPWTRPQVSNGTALPPT